jgi:hypothetical protein
LGIVVEALGETVPLVLAAVGGSAQNKLLLPRLPAVGRPTIFQPVSHQLATNREKAAEN